MQKKEFPTGLSPYDDDWPEGGSGQDRRGSSGVLRIPPPPPSDDPPVPPA